MLFPARSPHVFVLLREFLLFLLRLFLHQLQRCQRDAETPGENKGKEDTHSNWQKTVRKKYFSQLQKRFSRPSESSARSAEFFDAKVGLEAFFKLKTILEGKLK